MVNQCNIWRGGELFVLLLSLWTSSGLNIQPADENKELLLVHLVSRHGARTPADTYRRDPYTNHTFYPFGWGQITNHGKQELFEGGQWLRRRYDRFLGVEFTPNMVWAQTTDVPRTKVSMALTLAGLFPPAGTAMEWNRDLNWQPIPIASEPLAEDSLLLVRKPCARYYEALQEVFRLPEIKKILIEHESLFSELSAHSGDAIKTFDDIQSLYSTLRAESEYGLKLPEWTNDYFPHRLINLTKLSYIYNVYTPELQKFKGGPFIRKMIAEQEQKAVGVLKPSDRKLFMYTGHDSTVVNILAALNVWEQQFPTYGIMAMFELVRDKSTDEIGVQIYLRNGSAVDDAVPLSIPGCAHFCPFNQFKDAAAHLLSGDLNKDCRSKDAHFSTPEPPAP